jgi:hypothetical protein
MRPGSNREEAGTVAVKEMVAEWKVLWEWRRKYTVTGWISTLTGGQGAARDENRREFNRSKANDG